VYSAFPLTEFMKNPAGVIVQAGFSLFALLER
jgi:hypothetical protein